MSQPSPPFAIRPLAGGGTTVEQLRKSVLSAGGESELVLIQLKPAGVQFPRVCANCGEPAGSALRIERVFRVLVIGDGDNSNVVEPYIDSYDVPFCDACIRQHLAELVPQNPWTPLKRILSDGQGFGGLIVLGVALMFFYSALEQLSLVPLAFGAIPLSVSLWLLRITWNKSRYMSVPKPTNVDLAVDFTPCLSLEFEPAWRAFLFRSPQYAQLFSRQNIDTLWNPNSMEAQAAAARRRQRFIISPVIAWTVLGAVLAWIIWDEYLSEIVLPYFQK